MMKFNAAQFNVIKKATDFSHFKAVCHLTLNQMSGNGYAKERPFLCRASSAALSLAPTVSARRRPPARSDTESLEAVYGLAPILFSGKTEKFFIFLRARGEKGFGAETRSDAAETIAARGFLSAQSGGGGNDAVKKVQFNADPRGVAAKTDATDAAKKVQFDADAKGITAKTDATDDVVQFAADTRRTKTCRARGCPHARFGNDARAAALTGRNFVYTAQDKFGGENGAPTRTGTRGVAAKKMNGENTELGSSSPIYTVPKSIVYHCRDFRDGFGAAILVRLRQKNHQSTQEKTNER